MSYKWDATYKRDAILVCNSSIKFYGTGWKLHGPRKDVLACLLVGVGKLKCYWVVFLSFFLNYCFVGHFFFYMMVQVTVYSKHMSYHRLLFNLTNLSLVSNDAIF